MDIKGLVFPRRCPVCDGVLLFSGEKICIDCRGELEYIREPRCKKCGKQLANEEQEYCFDCGNKKHLFKTGIACFVHKGKVRESVYRLKYNMRPEYADFFADEIVRRYEKIIRQWDADGIVPVPLHRKKKLKRGYNQAEVIARRLGKRLGIKVYSDVLIRVKNTVPQKELDDNGRRKNLENAFKIKRNIVKLNKIILVDDIYTTGSTVDACTKIMTLGGVKEVYVICITAGKDK